ncbi:MAG: glycosyltransferase, partial [Bacteroidota bacterium]
MLSPLSIGARSLDDYLDFLDEEALAEMLRLAEPWREVPVRFLSPACKGSHAEVLESLVPLLKGLGIQVDWNILMPDPEVEAVFVGLRGALQGAPFEWTPAKRQIFADFSARLQEALPRDDGFKVLYHPLPVLEAAEGWHWWSSLDMRKPEATVWESLRGRIDRFDRLLLPSKLAGPDSHSVLAPALDPLHPRNLPMERERANAIVENFGLDPNRPLLLQIGRFDPWKDPLGVIEAYRLVKEQVPDLQLVLLGHLEPGDKEAWAYFNWSLRRTGEDFDVFILTDQNGVGPFEINAFQRVADVVLQKSVNDAFSLAAAEAQWKGQPVIAGNVGGLPVQIIEGQTGFLVDSVEDCAMRIYHLLKNPGESWEMGEMAR